MEFPKRGKSFFMLYNMFWNKIEHYLQKSELLSTKRPSLSPFVHIVHLPTAY